MAVIMMMVMTIIIFVITTLRKLETILKPCTLSPAGGYLGRVGCQKPCCRRDDDDDDDDGDNEDEDNAQDGETMPALSSRWGHLGRGAAGQVGKRWRDDEQYNTNT